MPMRVSPLRRARAAKPREDAIGRLVAVESLRGKQGRCFGVEQVGASGRPIDGCRQIGAVRARIQVVRVPIQGPLIDVAGQIELTQLPAPSVAVPTGAMFAAFVHPSSGEIG